MLTEAGMRMRRSFAAVMVDTAVSVTVIALIAAGTCPTVKTWFEADAIVGARTWNVPLSLPGVARRTAPTTSRRLSGVGAVGTSGDWCQEPRMRWPHVEAV